jgi:hypothetical protein
VITLRSDKRLVRFRQHKSMRSKRKVPDWSDAVLLISSQNGHDDDGDNPNKEPLVNQAWLIFAAPAVSVIIN